MKLLAVIFTIILIAAGLLIKKGKLLLAVQIMWLWVLTALNNGGMDYIDNEMIYIDILGKDIFSGLNSWLSNIIAYYFHKCNLGFTAYNAFLCTVSILALYFVIKKYSEKPCCVFSLFFIYPMSECVIQKRFFPCVVALVIALVMLMNRRWIGFVLSVVVATGWHFSGIIFLLFGAILFVSKKFARVIMPILLLAEIYIIFMTPSFLSIFSILPKEKIENYLRFNISFFAGSVFAGFVGIFIFLVLKVLHSSAKDSFHTMANGIIRQDQASILYLANFFSLLILPLLFCDSIFIRYYRPVLIMDYIFLTNSMRGSFLKNNLRYYYILLFISFLIVFAVGLMIFDRYSWRMYYETIFENNILFNI